MNFNKEKPDKSEPPTKKPKRKELKSEEVPSSSKQSPFKSEELPSSSKQPTKMSATNKEKTKQKPKSVTIKTKGKNPSSTGVKTLNCSVLQLKIILKDISPPIWRRIQVLNNITFAELHRNINEAMGWRSYHCHQFVIPSPRKPHQNIYIVDGTLEEFDDSPGISLKEQNTKVSRFFCEKGDSLLYEYDFGDDWVHRVVLEKVLPPPSPKAEYPKIKGGRRACPPEDCGGVEGYDHLIEVYKNPEHEEYEELIKEWLEKFYPGYDPEKFERKNIFKKVWTWVVG